MIYLIASFVIFSGCVKIRIDKDIVGSWKLKEISQILENDSVKSQRMQNKEKLIYFNNDGFFTEKTIINGVAEYRSGCWSVETNEIIFQHVFEKKCTFHYQKIN